jgi:hypothetical protein
VFGIMLDALLLCRSLHVSAYNLYVICAGVYCVAAFRADVAVNARVHFEVGFNRFFTVFTFCKHFLYPTP